MRANRVVRAFDRAVLALMAARRRRRRAAEMAELESALGLPDAEQTRGLGGAAGPAWGKRRRTALAAGAAAALASAVLVASALDRPAEPVPPWASEHVELLAQELDPSMPGWLERDLREQQRLNASRAVKALAAQDPRRSQDVRRTVAQCERAEGIRTDAPVCDRARDDAIRAGRALFDER